jgi:hypothetical protein
MTGQSERVIRSKIIFLIETLIRSKIRFITLFSAGAHNWWAFHQPQQTVQLCQFPEPNLLILTFLYPILLHRMTY